jgi:glycine/D-amino acid oxidase-like deaminating enzyme
MSSSSGRVPLAPGFANGGVSHWYRRTGRPEPGPRLPGPRAADVCVVGAGYTGLWTAYYLKRARPELEIVVLEREFAGFGASGRNGGWVLGEIAGSRERYAARHGRFAAVALQHAMFDAVDEVIRVAAAEGIDADLVKSGVLHVARNPAQRARLAAMVAASREWGWTEEDLVPLPAAERDERLRVAGATAAAWSPHCARAQPAKLVRGLAEAVRGLGVRVYERTPVVRIVPRRGAVPAAAVTPNGTVTAEYVLRATEGFTAGVGGHHRDWLPMNSSMIVTTPLPPAVWDAIGWDRRELLGDLAHYYMYAQRTADDRIAFGGRGARYHLGSAIHRSYDRSPRVRDHLVRTLFELFPAAAGARITHHWGGPLGVPRDWHASVGHDPQAREAWAGGYVGDGLSTTNLAGRTLADLLTGRSTELTRLPWVGHRSRPWEPEPLRFAGANAGLAAMEAADVEERLTGRPSLVSRALGPLIGH